MASSLNSQGFKRAMKGSPELSATHTITNFFEKKGNYCFQPRSVGNSKKHMNIYLSNMSKLKKRLMGSYLKDTLKK